MEVSYQKYEEGMNQSISIEIFSLMISTNYTDSVNPYLGLHSGCYEVQHRASVFNSRVTYKQTKPQRGHGQFLYCDGNIRSWIFDPNGSGEACDDKNVYLHSSEERPTSFSLLDAKNDQWLLGGAEDGGALIESLQMRKVEKCEEEVSDGDCSTLTMEATNEGFVDQLVDQQYVWSKQFNELPKQLTFYQHPIYKGISVSTEDHEIIFFIGRRWVLSSTQRLLRFTQAPPTSAEKANETQLIERLLSTENWLQSLEESLENAGETKSSAKPFAFVSEAVTHATDEGSPLGLRWYSAQYNQVQSFADISRPSDGLFICGNCNDQTNPCQNGGICEDGICDCTTANGATGPLCEKAPASDGWCNMYFNKEEHEWDR